MNNINEEGKKVYYILSTKESNKKTQSNKLNETSQPQQKGTTQIIKQPSTTHTNHTHIQRTNTNNDKYTKQNNRTLDKDKHLPTPTNRRGSAEINRSRVHTRRIIQKTKISKQKHKRCNTCTHAKSSQKTQSNTHSTTYKQYHNITATKTNNK